jgi:hypothetical protein
VIVDSLPFLAGAQMQAKTLDDAKAGIAGMRTYMSMQTPEQVSGVHQGRHGDRVQVTKPADHGHDQAMGARIRSADRG